MKIRSDQKRKQKNTREASIMDNIDFDDLFGNMFGTQYPPPLSPTRKIEMVRTEVSISGPCSSCVRGMGALTCSRCKAIKYCSKECQKYGSPLGGRNGWNDHKDSCNKIKKLSVEIKEAEEALTKEFGGTEVLLKTPLVKKGRFKYRDVTGELMGQEPPAQAKNPQERYILARVMLIEAYAKCGKEALSCTAFRLAAENMLDLLCLTYSKGEGEHVKKQYCGWMVAGGMDQKALNYLCYFQHRLLSPHPLPYLDLSNDEDIEGDSYLKMLKEAKNQNDFSTSQWFHDYMLIALIKYKRLQTLMVQNQKNKVMWRMFMMGTHPRAGKTSEILKIRGKSPVIEKLKSFLVEQSIDSRVDQLTKQMKEILTAVNEDNPLILPGILDRNSIPDKPPFQESDEDEDNSDEEIDEPERQEEDYIHDACWAFGNYGHAWNMSTAYARVLGLFLDTGNVTSEGMFNNKGSIPVEGFLQAAFDADPTRFYGCQDDIVPLWSLTY